MADKMIRSSVDLSMPSQIPDEERKELIRLAELHRENIDCSDIPPLSEEKWQVGLFYRGAPPVTSVQVDTDIVFWFQTQSTDYVARINEILRQEMRSAEFEPGLKKTA